MSDETLDKKPNSETPKDEKPPRAWCWSTDEERFAGDCATREEALEEAIESLGGEGGHVWLARVDSPRTVLTRGLFNKHFGSWFVEHASEQLYEEVGEVIEDHWSATEASPDQLADLTTRMRAAFDAWMEKHALEPNFFGVCELERDPVKIAPDAAVEHSIPEELVSDYLKGPVKL
jgi:hypothetical protein